MNVRDMSENELRAEFDAAMQRLDKAEAAYVKEQNVCSEIEAELNRRCFGTTKNVAAEKLYMLTEYWRSKIDAIKKTVTDDHAYASSLEAQRDTLKACISDLVKILKS